MTTTTDRKPVTAIAALRRADQRWASRQADEPAAPAYLDHLAKYLQPLVEHSAAAPVDDRELNQLREQVLVATNDAAARQAELDQAHAQIAELRTNLTLAEEVIAEYRADYELATRDNQKLADQLADLSRERDQLAKQLRAATAHQCTWEWPGPNKPVKDCTCGRPYPRHLPPFETEEIEPDREPWSELFDRIRDQLEGARP